MRTCIAIVILIVAGYMLLRSVASELGREAALRDMLKEADSCMVVKDYPQAYRLYNAVFTKKPQKLMGDAARNGLGGIRYRPRLHRGRLD